MADLWHFIILQMLWLFLSNSTFYNLSKAVFLDIFIKAVRSLSTSLFYLWSKYTIFKNIWKAVVDVCDAFYIVLTYFLKIHTLEMEIRKCIMLNTIQTVSKHVQTTGSMLEALEEDSTVPPINKNFLTNSNSQKKENCFNKKKDTTNNTI